MKRVNDYPPRGQTLKERFEHFVTVTDTEECILWPDHKRSPKGYGQFYWGKIRSAHKVSYSLYVGTIPDGMYVCHTCDNPPCVNPKHLWLGSHADNMKDMTSKGRGKVGERNGRSKLSEEDVKAIRADTRLQREIAADYGVSIPTISEIKVGRTWKHLA